MAQAQKPDFVFRRNWRVHLNRRGASVQSTTGSGGVRISGSNAGYTMFRGSVKSTGYPLHSPVSPSLPLPYVTVCHHISTGLYSCALFLDLGTRRGWGVSVTPRPYFTPDKDPVPIVQEAVWTPGPVWIGAENLAITGIRSPDRPARSQSLYRLSYRAHIYRHITSLKPGSSPLHSHFQEDALNSNNDSTFVTVGRVWCDTIVIRFKMQTKDVVG
jgi:hypothetical protein